MRKFKSAGRQQPTPNPSSKKLQVTTEFQSDYTPPSHQFKSQPSLEQAEMKRNLLALAEEYQQYYKDRVYLAFESEGPLPGPSPQWVDEGETEERDRLRGRQERYEDERAVQVDLRQFESTPSRYVSIKSSPITSSARSRKSSLPASHMSTPYKPSQDSVLSFLKTSTDTLAQALTSLGGFTNNMEQLMGNLSATTQALHSSIRSLEASQQPTPSPGYSHRSRVYETPFLTAFREFQSKRNQVESGFEEKMRGIETKLTQFRADVERKIQEANEGAEGKIEQLEEVKRQAGQLMTALEAMRPSRL